MKTHPNPYSELSRLHRHALIYLILALSAMISALRAQLPQSFTVTVDKGGGEMVELNLSKHTIRSANCRIVTWDSTEGYVEVHTPTNPAHPARTYRGYVTENPNQLVLAVVHEDNTLKAEAHDGEGRVWTISGVNVATEVSNGNSSTPTPAPLAAGTGTTVAPDNPGQYFPPLGLYQAHGVDDVPSKFYDAQGQSVSRTLTWLEHQWNVFDYFNARDAKLSMSLTEIIIRKEQYYFPTSGDAGGFNSLLRNEWVAQGQNKRGFIHSWFPYNFSYAGGYNTGKNMYAAGGEAIAVNALYHEVGHAWRAEHYYYGKETMTGSHPAHSEPNTQRILYTRQLEIDQDDGIELLTSYPTNIHPRAALDLTTTLVDTAVDISPLANDYDANGDVISIKSYTTNTAKGGSVTESNGILTYTPATGYVGKDIIVYEVQDAAGLFSKGLITVEVINQGLAAHWDMEDSSGSSATDLSGNGHTGTLDGTTFESASVAGPVGNAISLNASQRLIGDNSNLILDPDTSYPLDAVTSNFFDPLDADFSTAAWVKLAPGTDSALVFSKENKASFGYRLSLSTTSGLSARLRVWDGLTGSTSVSGGTVAADTWYHVAMVINRSDNTLRIYLNGQQVGSASVPANFAIFNGREDLQIGGTTNAFTGGAIAVDDVRIYTKALSVSEISALHAVGDVPAGMPSPADGSVNLAASGQTISWAPGQASYQHDIYFGTDAASVAAATTASTEYMGRQSGATFSMGALDYSTTYFWRIDEVDGSAIIPGTVWTFSTAATALTENLVLHLTMDDADVQTADGDSHTWDDIAFPAQDFEPFGVTSEGITGVIGQAVDLGAIDDSLRSRALNPINRPATGGVTFSFWINSTSANSNNEFVYNAGGGYAMLYNDGDLMPYFDGGSGGAQSFDTNINDGQWHHIVAQNDGAGTTTVYVDGLVVGTQSESLHNVGALDRNLAIGSDYDSTSQNLVAAFDDFAVWERALTHGEIFSIYQLGLAGNSFNDVPFLVNTSLEPGDGFTGFSSETTSGLGTVVANDGSTWTSVTDARIWNRNDIPPDGVQVITLANGGGGLGQVDVSFPGTDHGVGTVSFDYASYSGSANCTFRLLYNDGSGWVEAWSTQVIGNNPAWGSKPWPSVEVAINAPGDVDLRFETSGAKGAKFDNVKVTGIAGPQANSDPVFLLSNIIAVDGSPSFAYSGSITADAVDVNTGDSLTFTKLSGPSWLTIASDGTLSGSPSAGDLGDNVFTVQVSDGNGGTDTATLTISIGAKVFALYDATTNDPVLAGDVVSPLTADGGDWAMFDSSLGAGDLQEGALLTDAITGQSVYAWRNLDAAHNNNPGYSIDLKSDDIQVMWDNGWQLTAVVRLEQAGHFFSWNTFTSAPVGTYVANRRRGVSLNASGSDVTLTPQGGSGYTVTGALAQSFVKIVLSGAAGEETYTFQVYDLDDNLLHEQTAISPASNTSAAYVGIQSGSSSGDNREAYINKFELIPTIEDSNLPPSATDAAFAVNENLTAGASVGTVSASDPDAGDVLTYEITAGNVGGEFAIDSASGAITTTAALDYEVATQYLLTVTVTDLGGLSDAAMVTVNVTNENEAPTANDASGSVAENLAGGAAVASVSASDPDAGDTLGYTITAGNGGGLFAIDSNGNVTTTDSLDYEAATQHELTVTVADNGSLSDTATVTVNVTNVNEAPSAANSSGSLAENLAGGTAVATVSASDPDAVDSLSYAITAGNSGGFFSIDSSGNVTTTTGLNYEAATQHALTVTVTDGGGLSDTASVTVDVTNVNEAPFAADTSSSISEHALAGSSVATLAASDPDVGDNLSYAITAGNSGSAFAIDSSGVITTAASLDFETTASYSLTVTVTDGGSLSDTANVAVTVTDANDDPTFANDPITGANGVVFANYSGSLASEATDPDIADSLSYSKTAGPVWLNVATDGTLSGAPTAADGGVNVFTVEVSDGNGGTDQASLNITVDESGVAYLEDFQSYDVENPSDFSVGGTPSGNWTVSNTATDATRIFNTGNFGGTRLWISNTDGTSITSAGVEVGSNANYSMSSVMVTETSEGSRSVNATYDILVGQDAATAVSVIGGPQAVVASGDSVQTSGSKADHVFSHDFSTGSLNAGDMVFLRYQRVSTAVTGGWFGVDDVQLDLTGINHAPTVADAAFSIDEDATVGAAVGSVVASDPDAGDTLSYEITSGNTAGAFAIDTNGNVTTASQLDFETLTSYSLIVTVTDGGGLTDVATVGITVTDVAEITAPVVSTGTAAGITQLSADIGYSITDDGGEPVTVTLYYGESDGGTSSSSWANSVVIGSQSAGGYNQSISGLSEGTNYYYTIHAMNSAAEVWGSSSSFTTEADTSPKLVRTTVSAVSSASWTTVDLGENYNSAVIVATPIYASATTPPVVTRVRNVSGSSFDLKIDRADGLSDPVSIDVSVIAVEEGVYTQATDGVTMEAVKYTSTMTADNNSWVAESRSFQNSYTNPVVVGQVMSANDANWSTFWSMGTARQNPVDASNLNVGKHVGEDPNATRADETVGYIVIESGSGTINGVAYEAALGGDSVRGVGNSTTPYSYSLSGSLSSASAAAASISGMDGNNGAWAVLSGSPALTTTSIGLHAMEDKMSDNEQSHATTQVGYLIFE